MTDFTEGPWTFSGAGIKAGDEHIATTWALEFRVSDKRKDGESWLEMRERTTPERAAAAAEARANTHLIAAAPDMYAALRAFLEAYGSTDQLSEQARAALAKARGESQ